MSYGPLHHCYRCKAKLDINDPANGGYCGGHHCLSDPDRPRVILNQFTPSKTFKVIKKPTIGNRKSRRKVESKARRKKK